jgi:hypothetical protein
MTGMMLGMGALWLLFVILLVLAVGALLKYLLSGK